MKIIHHTLVASAVAASLLLVGASAGYAGEQVTISAGHVDAIDLAFEDGVLERSVHDETVTPDVERDPADVTFEVLAGAQTAVPDDAAYAFLGNPGATVSVLPEAQNPDLVWPGIATEEIEAGVFRNDTVRVDFTSLCGPDGFSMFTDNPDGTPKVLIDSEDYVADRLTLPVGTHQHASWAFEKPGTYRLTYRASGVLAATGQTVRSAPATLTFVVR